MARQPNGLRQLWTRALAASMSLCAAAGPDTLGSLDEFEEFLNAGRVEETRDALGDYALNSAQTHDTDLRNRLEGVTTDVGGNPVSVPHVHDLAGNLVADDGYWYQYDAFNRLASVHAKGSLSFDSSGNPTSGTPGSWKLYLAYDALGRLISIQKPWTGGTDHRKVWLYYDGVRRIMEVFKDPVLGQGGPVGGGGGGGGGYTTYTDREYVWGPDYVDECLWQVTKVGDVLHVLQDGSMDVVATVDSAGAVARQWSYDPYGQPIVGEAFGSSAHDRLGHHGLFFDRLDAAAPGIELVSAARGLYHNRNRTYEPRLGRFTSNDPHETALATMAQAMLGKCTSADASQFDALGLFADGPHLYGYLGEDPLSNQDAMGLDWQDWWDDTQEGAGVVLNAYDTFTSFSDPGGLLGAILETMITNYSMNMESDVGWAGDWTQGDDWHTRRDSAWVTEAMLLGAYKHFNLAYWMEDSAGSNGPAMASIRSTTGKTASELADTFKKLRANMVFDTYHKAKAVKHSMGLGSKWDAHHILPRSWAKQLGLTENGPAILLLKERHKGITKQLNHDLKRLKQFGSLQEKRAFAKRTLRRFYGTESESWEAIEDMFK